MCQHGTEGCVVSVDHTTEYCTDGTKVNGHIRRLVPRVSAVLPQDDDTKRDFDAIDYALAAWEGDEVGWYADRLRERMKAAIAVYESKTPSRVQQSKDAAVRHL